MSAQLSPWARKIVTLREVQDLQAFARERDELVATLAARVHDLEKRLHSAQTNIGKQRARAEMWKARERQARAAKLKAAEQHERAEMWKARAVRRGNW